MEKEKLRKFRNDNLKEKQKVKNIIGINEK